MNGKANDILRKKFNIIFTDNATFLLDSGESIHILYLITFLLYFLEKSNGNYELQMMKIYCKKFHNFT